MTTNDLQASISLKRHHVANKLILEAAQFGTELDYDRYMDQFELMTSLAESLLKSRAHALLVGSFKREGGWDSNLASSIGRWTIDKEEKDLENISKAEEVVESSRIAVTEITSLGR
ncbi:uncharacterized protein EAF01_001369 [Botrytis porri]|uniref:uncharacterized protein n=1 Tax=Botrytis porri TaxID=87229 RepID=UPI0019015630|nr:uncharacterized protein EAF01_001369 [Botrytis porri]KAF7912348.1 hypothetical protein EAF01_001369 [Botrytis porri]